jgi:hypothetical protein
MKNIAITFDRICGCFMSFQFPEPKGGGIVIVNYPFAFQP